MSVASSIRPVVWPAGPFQSGGFASLTRLERASLSVGGSVAWRRRRGGPFRGDDRVELRSEQALLRAQLLKELLVHGKHGGVAVGVAGRDMPVTSFRR